MNADEDQSVWGSTIPPEVLHEIFKYAVRDRDCLPTICNIGKVCRLWYHTSLSPLLWHTVDLGTWTKEKYRNDNKLNWIIENRLMKCREVILSAGNWKIKDMEKTLNILYKTCPGLVGIGLSGWKKLMSNHLDFIVKNFKSLQMLDLSSINVLSNPKQTAVSLQSLCNATQSAGDQLTHLNLSNNRLSGVSQIVTALCMHCPNLLSLDLSIVNTISRDATIHIENLQMNCKKLKILRLANSNIVFNTATLEEETDSPGFQHLEQLSIASSLNEFAKVNDEILHRILKSSTKLKLLDLRNCPSLTYHSLVRLPSENLKYLFLSGCSITRESLFLHGQTIGLELIVSKWAHSLMKLDLGWTNLEETLDGSLKIIAQSRFESPLRDLDLRGSSVSSQALAEILVNCQLLEKINLESCRSLPRGIKRVFEGSEQINTLRKSSQIGATYTAKKRKVTD